MQVKTITRIGSGGRVVIPKDIRVMMELKEDDFLEVVADEDGTVFLQQVSAYVPNVKVAMSKDSSRQLSKKDIRKMVFEIMDDIWKGTEDEGR